MDIMKRKNDHIEICLKKNVQAERNYWDDVYLHHKAIPCSDLESIDLGATILGKELKAPLIISSMTGGSPKAKEYNELLARAASEYGIGMGVGSQRAALEKNEHISSYTIVKEYDIPLTLGNLGAPQFARGKMSEHPYGPEEAKKALEMVDGDALCLHLNYLQEVVQPEGDTFAGGLLETIEVLTCDFPIVAKETGAGISRETALDLRKTGVKAIDVGGMSGTSFSAVEAFRSPHASTSPSRPGVTLWNWGIPTPVSTLLANVGPPVISTGGLRNGLDIARALALGASCGGMAWALLKPASNGYEDLKNEISMILKELKAVLFLSGAHCIEDMVKIPYVLTGKSREIMESITGVQEGNYTNDRF